MLLADDIAINIAGEAIRLRPCLRHALRLERRPGSFSALARDVIDGSLTAACEIIRPHVPMPHLERHVLPELDSLKEPLIAYVMACAGIDPDDHPEPAKPSKPAKPGKSIPFAEYLTGLYRIATGWLGWTPDVALAATPAEIMEAHMGRMDMLKAIFGSAEPEADDKPTMSLDEKIGTAFRSLGTKKVKRGQA